MSQAWTYSSPCPPVLVLLGQHLTSLILHCHILKSGPAHFCGVTVGGARALCSCSIFGCNRQSSFPGRLGNGSVWAVAWSPFLPPLVEDSSVWRGGAAVPILFPAGGWWSPHPPDPGTPSWSGSLLCQPPPGLQGLAVPHPPCGLGPAGEEGFCLLDYPGEKWGLGPGKRRCVWHKETSLCPSLLCPAPTIHCWEVW